MASQDDTIIDFVRINGPVLPHQVAKLLNYSIMMTSAILADLTQREKLLLTNLKAGGSPFYYLKGQDSNLQRLSSHLGDVQKKAYAYMKEKQVLRDKDCEPWKRVALREIKDFAIRLRVVQGGVEEIFWKWYLLPEDQTRNKVEELLYGEKSVLPEKVVTEKRDVQENLIKKKDAKKTHQKKPSQAQDSQFAMLVKKYVEDKKAKVLKEDVRKKDIEINLDIEVPSEFGMMKFFVAARNKRKVNEADLSLAYNQARGKPVLFLTT
ncbi:hypothetical protein J4430_04185, partial [Candidatus Woesearchaeota archaeon]|nr:hypothetical protein [Candidatus Woesearchaeota archaeon]